MAEDSGLIVDLDLWVLTEACRTLFRWQAAGLAGPETTMAVNLSARHFAQPGLAEKVRRALSETGLNQACLTLEITEHAVMTEPERALVILRQLKGVGVGLAIDDFGTGYSSLAYLQSFPIDVLKIDRSFIKDLSRESGSFEIIRAVVGLGQGLSLKVVAEGVEESGHLDILEDLQCQFAQGYLFSRPHRGGEGRRAPAQRTPGLLTPSRASGRAQAGRDSPGDQAGLPEEWCLPCARAPGRMPWFPRAAARALLPPSRQPDTSPLPPEFRPAAAPRGNGRRGRP